VAPTEISDQAVNALLHRWFPGETAAFARMQSGSSTPVYRVTHDDRVSYLRLAEHPGEIRDGEVRAHEQALQAGISVPEIIRWDPKPPELDRSATLTATIPGIPLGEYEGDPLPAAISMAATSTSTRPPASSGASSTLAKSGAPTAPVTSGMP
jgi:hypothetical protein